MRDHKNVAMNDESKIPADCRFSFSDNRIENNLNSIKIRYELEGAQDDSVCAKDIYAAQKLRGANEDAFSKKILKKIIEKLTTSQQLLTAKPR